MDRFMEKIAEYIPIVRSPSQPLTFKERLKHTIIVLVLYFILTTIPIWGVSSEISTRLREISWVMGSSFGTIGTLGIGPIVLAGIFLQLLLGGGILNININTEEGRIKFDNYQRALTFIFILLESVSILALGALKPDASLGIPPIFLSIIIFIQLVIGGLIIVLLDDYCLKYGITAGVNLFILASISRMLMIRLLNFLPPVHGETATGAVFLAITLFSQGNLVQGIAWLLKIAVTFGILFLAAYLQAVRVEVPLLMARVGGRVMKFPISILYTSVIPIILLYALIVEIESLYMFITHSNQVPWILTPPNIIYNLSIFGLSYITPWEVLHIIIYLLIYVVGAAVLSYLWVISAGMDAKTIAKQLLSSYMFPLRVRDPRILERTLEKYIRPVSILSGILIGLLAAVSNILGSLLPGTSLLLLVVIAYNIYEDFVRNNVVHLLPVIGKMLSNKQL